MKILGKQKKILTVFAYSILKKKKKNKDSSPKPLIVWTPKFDNLQKNYFFYNLN